jgi:ABC-type bacteriocin/lantibiotic exporter with double-glycine peptidase domain
MLLSELFRHINQRRRRQIALLLGLTVLSSFAEVVSLGAVLPFIGILTDPDRVFASPAMAEVAKIIGINNGNDLVLPLAIGFASAALAAGALRLLLLWVSTRFGNATGADLSIEIYRRTLYQPYRVHVSRSSSEIISGITQKVVMATRVLVSGVSVITSATLFVAILATLFAIDPVGATIAVLSFGFAYGVIAWLTRRRLVYNSQCIAREQTHVVRSLQEGMGAIRDVLLDGTQEIYCEVYRKAIFQLQRAGGENAFINQAPRYAMESLGMALIAVFVVVMNGQAGGVLGALPTLGMLALGAQRLLPLMQQLYGNWTVVAGSKAALVDVLNLLDQPLPSEAYQRESSSLDLNESIQVEDVKFRYAKEGAWVLSGVNLNIPKGARVGFIGRTGSGKSSILDLIMGLLEPDKGRILIDGQPVTEHNRRAWQLSIAHVPQSIFLADASIAENIAFGVPSDKIDLARVRKAAEQARIADFIEDRPKAYETIVGERGVQLSGGQRQRIGIARALYKQASVLVFDEATSALDAETEDAVMQAIEGLSRDLTLLIIAHRITTLKSCTMIIELDAGGVKRIGTYDEIVGQSDKIKALS